MYKTVEAQWNLAEYISDCSREIRLLYLKEIVEVIEADYRLYKIFLIIVFRVNIKHLLIKQDDNIFSTSVGENTVEMVCIMRI